MANIFTIGRLGLREFPQKNALAEFGALNTKFEVQIINTQASLKQLKLW